MTQYVQEKVARLEQPITAWVLLGIIGVLTIAYGCFINATITNIVSTKTIQAKIASLTPSVSALESRYLAAKSSITMDDALADGFSQSNADPIYISRATAGSLSFNR
ncbi:MAG TPA: hypothetical protein VFT82_04245 [Candidatus Paceibacterota bacterium]|nr:hypothetical protein [Candidatus Paceibacterota bacterium]